MMPMEPISVDAIKSPDFRSDQSHSGRATSSGKIVLTYGTFDLLHIGHLNLLKRLREMGERLIVGVSTDSFNEAKGKRTIIPFRDRIQLVESLSCVDMVVPEHSWDQKREDIKRYGVSIFGIGADWKGKFDDLHDLCEVVYLERTRGVSSTELKRALTQFDKTHVDDLKTALDIIRNIVDRLQ